MKNTINKLKALRKQLEAKRNLFISAYGIVENSIKFTSLCREIKEIKSTEDFLIRIGE